MPLIALITVGLILVVVTLIYANQIEPNWFEVTQTDLDIQKLPIAFDGYRIAHISDIHMDGGMTKDRLLSVAEKITEQQVDLIVITGDFVSNKVAYVADNLRDALSAFNAPDGILAVMGNHDHKSGVERVRGILAEVGIHELTNDVTSIECDNTRLYIAGVDDLFERKARLDLVLQKLPDDHPTILLAHEPDFADIATATGRFALQLSGHTHAGQVRLPLLGIVHTPDYGKRYRAGLYNVNNLQVYVTRGLGTVDLPIRFNCRPEITILTLHTK
ncbi:MAG: metallophosphoesterase [Chloroflexota bacterium]